MKKGFSLVELMLFMALSGVFLAMTGQLLKSAIDFKLETTSSSAADLAGQFIYNRISYDLRRASSILVPASAGGTGTTLSLVINGQTHTYTLLNNRLLLTTPNGVEDISDSGVIVENFTVTKTGVDPQTPGVKLEFSLESVDVTGGDIAQQRDWEFAYTIR